MEQVRKTFFNPLATSKAQIRALLEGLPVGSAHPFSPERILLCRTEHGVDEIDISPYKEDYFFNAVDLGEMGEILLRRMARFKYQTSIFDDYEIQQAPAATFKVPIVSGKITIFTLSERNPTYYDLCLADASSRSACFNATNTFNGIFHSGDVTNDKDILHNLKINEQATDSALCVFISGYQSTPITKFMGTHPALLVADHADKVLYIIPVPLDSATVGDSTICCPLVIKHEQGSLLCSILPTATTDKGKMCSGSSFTSPCFLEAIRRADFTVRAPQPTVTQQLVPVETPAEENAGADLENVQSLDAKHNAVWFTDSVTLPSSLHLETTQLIRFGTGVEFKLPGKEFPTRAEPSTVVLPCIFGSQLEGPLLLATGTVSSGVPFLDDRALREYYKEFKNAVVIVDERMTDNARNLASSWRINALFIVQLSPEAEPEDSDEVLSLLNSANINAVTALAGPQSLVLVQISEKYYFYRGLANRAHLNTSGLAFGSDVTSIFESAGIYSMLDPKAQLLINLDDENKIILPVSGQLVRPQDLEKAFEELPIEQVLNLQEDISAAVPQLQILMNHKDLQQLSKALVSTLSAKVGQATTPLRNAYVDLMAQEYKSEDAGLTRKKSDLLGELRKTTKKLQSTLGPVISALGNMMSSQATSKRTHDLKRLVRQAQIHGNVEAARAMTFDTLSAFLETHATEMGVMLLNINTEPYGRLLNDLTKGAAIDASSCCDLDSRILFLDGFDAGIIMEQSQSNHDGPLQRQAGSTQPILSLPYLNQDAGHGSMLAWVCWDEFVDLESPFTVRWMEKCNDAHIAALRIIMRSTLSQAVASREHDMQPGSPQTGQLMSALLMAAMSKLAGMRTTAPVVVQKAEDTVVKLMRGLFGNLLTIAGSGVRPLSMVWQLFGLHPQCDIPTTAVDWVWYETVVALYPYTGWPLEQFHKNLEKLLDKTIIRVVTKGEDIKVVKASRVAEMIKYCKLRNIQLDHSRTIITILVRMLTRKNVDIAAVASRLLDQLPPTIQRPTQSYSRLIKYLEHLAKGGQRRAKDDLVAASTYTTRSAAFAELKTKVMDACVIGDWAAMKESCQALLDKHATIAALWQVEPQLLKFQNMEPYKNLSSADFDEGVDQDTKSMNHALTRQVLSDAEINRVPWQVGKEGEFGKNIEPLDESLLHEVLTGEKLEAVEVIEAGDEPADKAPDTETPTAIVEAKPANELEQFKSTLQPKFYKQMEKTLSAEDACEILQVPASTMRVFVKALNPSFVWEDLGQNFKAVILDLLHHRSNREQRFPFRKLLGTDTEKGTLQIEG